MYRRLCTLVYKTIQIIKIMYPMYSRSVCMLDQCMSECDSVYTCLLYCIYSAFPI